MASCVAQFNKISIQKGFEQFMEYIGCDFSSIPFDILIKYEYIFPKFTLSYT